MANCGLGAGRRYVAPCGRRSGQPPATFSTPLVTCTGDARRSTADRGDSRSRTHRAAGPACGTAWGLGAAFPSRPDCLLPLPSALRRHRSRLTGWAPTELCCGRDYYLRAKAAFKSCQALGQFLPAVSAWRTFDRLVTGASCARPGRCCAPPVGDRYGPVAGRMAASSTVATPFVWRFKHFALPW